MVPSFLGGGNRRHLLVGRVCVRCLVKRRAHIGDISQTVYAQFVVNYEVPPSGRLENCLSWGRYRDNDMVMS